MNNELIVIDCDLINRLKRQGRKLEAKEILQTYYADLKTCKKNALSDFKVQNKMIQLVKGICLGHDCNRKARGIYPLANYCQRCYESKTRCRNRMRDKK